METKPSLHLLRPAESQATPTTAPAVQLRTVEHYRLVHGFDESFDPDA